MTTYHSQAVTTKDRDGNELTLKTLNIDGEEAVLAAAVDVELPDGQQVTVNVLYDSEDVAGLLAYLHDNFGRSAKPAPLSLPWDDPEANPLADVQAVQAQNEASLRTYSPADVVGVQFPDGFPERAPEDRQCPVIYSGVRCDQSEHPVGTDHFFPGFPQVTKNDAGAATPPADAQGASTPTQPASTGQSAAESATAATPAAEAAPASTSDEKPKRKRRLKVEKAYDDALKVWKEGKGDSVADGQTLSEAYEALKAKDPGNSRLVQTVPAEGMPLTSNPDEAQPAPVGFAPEQTAYRPIPNNGYDPALHAAEEQFEQQAFQVPAFAPGQTQQLGQVSVTPEEQQAASGFPCPVQSTDGRPCQRPYGHELQTATNPQPKPHVYATADPSRLGQAPQPQVTDPLPWAPPGTVNDTYLPAAQQPVMQSVPFQVPPTPAAAPHPETNFQPPAPAAPSWAEPV